MPANSTSLAYLPIIRTSHLGLLTLKDPIAMSSVSDRSRSTSASKPGINSTRHHRSSSDHLRPQRCVGKWQLGQLAGCGTFTDVYLAKPLGCRPDWPADYAIKLLRPKYSTNPLAIESMRREAEAASDVSHRHLVAILEAHLTTEQKYLVMPKLEGVSLGQIIERAGYISVRQALWIARQACEALASLHHKRWLHGDVKPDNIMFSSEGHVTLIDLGFSLRFAEAMLTETRAAKGTFNFMSPETMTSAYCSDQRSDIYSLGISLYNMLTGRLPFEGKSPSELIEAHRGKPLPDPRDFNRSIPDGVVRLLSRMTAKQPVRRPQTAHELIQDLLPLEVAAMRADRAASRHVA